MNKFNEKNSDFYDLEYFLSLEYRYFSGAHKSRVKNISKYLNSLELKGKSVLDIGCSGGHLTDKISKLGAKVTGCDYSQFAIQFAKERYPYLNIIECSAYEINTLEINNLDLITAFDVVEHLKSPEIFLRKAFKMLKRDGLLLINTDNEDYLFNKRPYNYLKIFLLRTSSSGRAYRLIKKVEAYRKQFKNYHQSHINIMPIPTLIKNINHAGFQIEKVIIYPLTSIPILDFFTKFLPLTMKGDCQLIIAKKLNR